MIAAMDETRMRECGYPDKTVFANSGDGPDWARGHRVLTPVLVYVFHLILSEVSIYTFNNVEHWILIALIRVSSLPRFVHLTDMYRLLIKECLWIPECSPCSMILCSFVVMSIARPFFLANTQGSSDWSQCSQSFRWWKIFSVSSFQKKSLWAQGMRWLPSIEIPLSPLRVCIILRGPGTCAGFSRRKLGCDCRLSTQRQWSECSFGNPKDALFSSRGVLSSAIVRGHCHLVEKHWGGYVVTWGKPG